MITTLYLLIAVTGTYLIMFLRELQKTNSKVLDRDLMINDFKRIANKY